MKSVSSWEIRTNPKPVVEAAEGREEVVLIPRGEPVALLLGVSGEDLGETVRLVRRARAQAAVSRLRKGAVQRDLESATLEDIGEEVRAARAERVG